MFSHGIGATQQLVCLYFELTRRMDQSSLCLVYSLGEQGCLESKVASRLYLQCILNCDCIN